MRRAGKRGASPSLSRALRRKETALREVGSRNIRAAKLRIGTTRRLTPTKSGFAALNRTFLEAQKHQAKDKRAAWTLDLDLRYRGPDGRFIKAPPLEGIGFPRLVDVRRRRRELAKQYRDSKGKRGRLFKSEAEAYRYMAENVVKGAVFSATQNITHLRKGRLVSYEMIESMIERGASQDDVREAFRTFKETRGVSFKVTVNRAIPKSKP